MVLDVEYELQKLIDQINSEKKGGCCNRGRLIKRFSRVYSALAKARQDPEYAQEDLDKIEVLLEELADQQHLNLSGLKRR
jgi:hypothetical protein